MKRLNKFANENSVPMLAVSVGDDGAVTIFVEKDAAVIHSFRLGRGDVAKLGNAMLTPKTFCVVWPALEVVRAKRKSAQPPALKSSPAASPGNEAESRPGRVRPVRGRGQSGL